MLNKTQLHTMSEPTVNETNKNEEIARLSKKTILWTLFGVPFVFPMIGTLIYGHKARKAGKGVKPTGAAKLVPLCLGVAYTWLALLVLGAMLPKPPQAAGAKSMETVKAPYNQEAAFLAIDKEVENIMTMPAICRVAMNYSAVNPNTLYEAAFNTSKAYETALKELEAIPEDHNFDNQLFDMIYGSDGFITLYIEHSKISLQAVDDVQKWLENDRKGTLREKNIKKGGTKYDEAQRARIRARNYASDHPITNQ